MKTIFCDIDGTLLKHQGSEALHKVLVNNCSILNNAIESITYWKDCGYTIILTTGRTESMRNITNKQLENHGIFYDQLIMGLPRGERILINDCKPDGTQTALAVNLKRNEGLQPKDYKR